MAYTPRFQAQNPAISGYSLGWLSCTAFSAGMAGDYHTLGAKRPTGAGVRSLTGDTTGGLNLAQVDGALNKGWSIDLDVRYRYSWDAFVGRIDAGEGAILQGYYAPIADSQFDAGGGFRGNHAIFLPPGWGAMDPLADGRRSGIYEYSGDPYPRDLLRRFAGLLILDPKTNQRLGLGLVYAAFTRDNTANYRCTIRPLAGQEFRRFGRYFLNQAGRVDVSKSVFTKTAGFSVTCSAPKAYRTTTGKTISLVQITQKTSSRYGWYVSSSWAHKG